MLTSFLVVVYIGTGILVGQSTTGTSAPRPLPADLATPDNRVPQPSFVVYDTRTQRLFSLGGNAIQQNRREDIPFDRPYTMAVIVPKGQIVEECLIWSLGTIPTEAFESSAFRNQLILLIENYTNTGRQTSWDSLQTFAREKQILLFRINKNSQAEMPNRSGNIQSFSVGTISSMGNVPKNRSISQSDDTFFVNVLLPIKPKSAYEFTFKINKSESLLNASNIQQLQQLQLRHFRQHLEFTFHDSYQNCCRSGMTNNEEPSCCHISNDCNPRYYRVPNRIVLQQGQNSEIRKFFENNLVEYDVATLELGLDRYQNALQSSAIYLNFKEIARSAALNAIQIDTQICISKRTIKKYENLIVHSRIRAYKKIDSLTLFIIDKFNYTSVSQLTTSLSSLLQLKNLLLSYNPITSSVNIPEGLGVRIQEEQLSTLVGALNSSSSNMLSKLDSVNYIKASAEAELRLAENLIAAANESNVNQQAVKSQGQAVYKEYVKLYDSLFSEIFYFNSVVNYRAGELQKLQNIVNSNVVPTSQLIPHDTFKLQVLSQLKRFNEGYNKKLAVAQPISSSLTYPLSFNRRTHFYYSLDFGFSTAFFGFGEGKTTTSILPYVGVNLYFAPVDKDIPLSYLRYSRRREAALKGSSSCSWFNTLLYRTSATVAITYSTNAFTSAPSERRGLIGNQALLVGIGYRVKDSFRITMGTTLFYSTNQPKFTQFDQKLAASPFIGIAFDWDVRGFFTNIFSGTNPF